ncbi:MAG: response regulator transcription factor [Chloroflexi bacterium]|nr:response regulator transcription factor [Chloroflexota bacterium]
MKSVTILLVDDDPVILKFVAANLKIRGFNVITAENGETALTILEKTIPDLVLLDLLMPKLDGMEVCRRIREWSSMPIIILTAVGEPSKMIELLHLGADDYITKPFGIDELMARVKSILRRESAKVAKRSLVLSGGELKVNLNERHVTVGEREVSLTPTEYNILRLLGLNAGKVLSHEMLLSKIWGPENSKEMELLRVYIARLRNKLEDNPKAPKYIVTKPRIGYCLQGLQPRDLAETHL